MRDHADSSEVVTGATGSLGSHIAARLSVLDDVQRVYCLVRAQSTPEAYERVLRSMRIRRVYETLSESARTKLVALPSDLSQPTLGLDAQTYHLVASQITELIHCAWSVNFNLHLSSFEKDSIAGVANLIGLCLQAQRPRPASFNFCSSVSAVMHTAGDEISESLPEKLSYAQKMGYAQSKLVGEHICINATKSTGISARVLRIGQVIGDTQHGIWNATEAIPLIFQCATTIRALPKLNEFPLWLPVDTVANAVIDISLSSANGRGEIFNIVSPRAFHWTTDLLLYLRRAGLEFEALEPKEWVQRLRQSEPDPMVNPPIKLVEFFSAKYDANTEEAGRCFLWHTEHARRVSLALAQAQPVDEELVRRMVEYFRRECWR